MVLFGVWTFWPAYLVWCGLSEIGRSGADVVTKYVQSYIQWGKPHTWCWRWNTSWIGIWERWWTGWEPLRSLRLISNEWMIKIGSRSPQEKSASNIDWIDTACHGNKVCLKTYSMIYRDFESNKDYLGQRLHWYLLSAICRWWWCKCSRARAATGGRRWLDTVSLHRLPTSWVH